MNRNLSLDVLKLALSLMVVGLHGFFLLDVSPGVSDALGNTLFRVAVPTFFVINGYYFHAAQNKGPQAVRRWVWRLVQLYAVWSLVYLYFMLRDVSLSLVVWNLLRGFWHLWYLVGTLMAAGLMLVLRRWSLKWMLLLALVAYLTGWALQYTGRLNLTGTRLDAWVGHLPVYRNGVFFGFPLFALGYVCAQESAVQRWSPGRLVGLILLGAGALAAEFTWTRQFDLPERMPLDIALGLVPLALGLFLLALRSTARYERGQLSDVSTLIYLAHPLFLLILPRWFKEAYTELTLLAMLGSLALAPLVFAAKRRWPWVL
jgi:surface polysaccharide O-acyltransferase-like enzyme